MLMREPCDQYPCRTFSHLAQDFAHRWLQDAFGLSSVGEDEKELSVLDGCCPLLLAEALHLQCRSDALDDSSVDEGAEQALNLEDQRP